MNRGTFTYHKESNGTDPDIVYYNCDIINNKTIDAGFAQDPIVRFSETRDQPIISDSSKYEFSIIRFTLNGANKNLPILIPSIQTGQNNPNLTVYSCTIVNGAGLPFQTYIQFIPEEATAPIPASPFLGQDLTTNYYYVYTYDRWVQLVNTALQASHTAAGYAGQPPLLSYSPTTTLFTLCLPPDYYGGGTATLYFNSNLYGLVSNFPANSTGQDDPNGKDWFIVPSLQVNLSTPTGFNHQVLGATTNLILSQDYNSTGSLWSPIASIVFQSSFIPIVAENIGTPVRFGESSTNLSRTVPSNFSPTITDISLATETSDQWRGLIYYSPTGEYRMTSLQGKNEIRSIDIQVYWKNRLDGRLVPLSLFNLSSCSIKMMFRRKGL